MAQTYTRWGVSSDTSLRGDIYIGVQATYVNPTFTFTFPNGDYLDQTFDEAGNAATYIEAGVNAYFLLDVSNLELEFPDEDNTQHFNSVGENIAFRQTKMTGGVFHYEITQGADSELQYVIIIPAIEEAITTLANKLVDSQCNCQMNRSVMDNFVKAKALQQLIYAKVADQGTTLSTTFLIDVNADVNVLQDFLQGTTDVCGC